MTLEKRESVEATTPVIYIGHRIFTDKKSGERKKSRTYHAEYNHLGEKFHEPLKTTNRTAAIRAANAICDRLARGEGRHLQRRVDWDQMTVPYLTLLQDIGRAPKTIQKYRYVLNKLTEFGKSRRTSPQQFRAAEFWAFNAHLRDEQKLDEKTRYCWLIVIKQLWKWASSETPKLLLTNALASIKLSKPKRKSKPCFTPDQISTILERADARYEGPVFSALSYLGLRIGEARSLVWLDVDLDSAWVTVRDGGGATGTTKDDAVRRIPIHPELRKVFERLPHREGFVFRARPSAKYPAGDGPISARHLLLSIKRLCKRLGFSNPRQYTLHTFRHTFASMLARSNKSQRYALALMGHSSSEILDWYFHQFDDTAKDSIDALNYCPSTPENG
jgi:integrase